jgi:squalene synthase HpnC
MADDIADHETASPDEKLARLAAIQATLLGNNDDIIAARDLREIQIARGLSPDHILDLLEAFRRDVRQSRYADWGELMDYCRFSAAPVGRFVLDVHQQDEATWPASDALCAALQVINHLQDCGKDFRTLDRVYIPLDALRAAGVEISTLGLDAAPSNLREVIAGMATRTMSLLEAAHPLIRQVSDRRLALEIGVIHHLATDLTQRLRKRDPLSERVHHRPYEALAGAVLAAAGVLAQRHWGSAKRRSGAIETA